MQTIEQGDIYWVTLTGVGSEQSGRRPCIVMSRLAVNNAGRTVIIVPMTTTVTSANPYYRILLPVSEIIKDPSCASTIQTSVAKCDHARVLDKSLLEGKIGKLTQTAAIAVALGLAYVFDIR
jgi:mRNA-degrading endonuclease toxin of MazEF toxin-antitoxin module